MSAPLRASTLAVVLVLVLASPVAAQGPKDSEIPGLRNASDAPEGLYVPEGMNPAFRTFIVGYSGFLSQVASREAGFRNTLQEIVTSSGQTMPPPASNWSEAADLLFGTFDMAYSNYKQVVLVAQSGADVGTTTSPSTTESTLTSGEGSAVDGSTVDSGALAVGLTGVLALLGASGATVLEYISKLLAA